MFIYGIQSSSRMHYVRYADNWIIGITGPKTHALQIKEEFSLINLAFLQEILKLLLHAKITKPTNLSSESLFLAILISITTCGKSRYAYLMKVDIYTWTTSFGKKFQRMHIE